MKGAEALRANLDVVRTYAQEVFEDVSAYALAAFEGFRVHLGRKGSAIVLLQSSSLSPFVDSIVPYFNSVCGSD
eukprot:2380338-Amphidinium_carterae.1